MSSANEHLPPPAKTRMSPLDFRNTDLVSRLLAATPPYLYNMSLLPNTYFFSEMLRSFVQAKNEQTGRAAAASIHHPSRRSRKRTWSSTKPDCYQKNIISPKPSEKQDIQTDWMLKSNTSRVSAETPLELTINKVDDNDNKVPTMSFPNKHELNMAEPMYPGIQSNICNAENPSNLVLPPPPPMWYPPLYPTPPYGIDPLHFFIDLRVSGHIYDRKNQKETITSSSVVPQRPSEEGQDMKPNEIKQSKDIFQSSRHASAFSVPVPRSNKTSPMNLTHLNSFDRQETKTKFDVKSMGFDKHCNKTSTNYIMNNIESIYKSIHTPKQEEVKQEIASSINSIEGVEGEETEEMKEKRDKDLRALIGLELVVDYMSHKPIQGQLSQSFEGSSNATDSESSPSPALEVVALHDET